MYAGCPLLLTDDPVVFKVTDFINKACVDAIMERLDGVDGEGQRLPTGRANLISTAYSTANNIGYNSHTDFNPTDGAEDGENFDDVPLPTKAELTTLTFQWNQTHLVMNPGTHSTYKMTDMDKKTLAPEKGVPGCEDGPVVITGKYTWTIL